MSNVSPANQHTSDEREQPCWDLYLAGVVKGQVNAYKAAIDAGYSEDQARNITIQGWFKERLEGLQRTDIVSKSEKKFVEALDYPAVDQEGKVDVNLLRSQIDVAKYATSTLKKDVYSTKTETDITSGGEKIESLPLTPAILAITKEYEEKMKQALLD